MARARLGRKHDGKTSPTQQHQLLKIEEKQIEVRLRLNLYELEFAAQLDRNADHLLS